MTRECLRPELASIVPPRMCHRPIDERGYTVPWFVEWINGKPDFRVMDRRKFYLAIKNRLCWLCGEKLGVFMTFCIGPMCVVNRITSEPPCHLECAEYAAKGCPFLTHPHAKYRTGKLPNDAQETPGMLTHNPTACALYTTRSYRPRAVNDGVNEGVLLMLGEPESVTFWHKGRHATRDEAQAAMNVGLPHLRAAAESEGGDAPRVLDERLAYAQRYLPAEAHT